MGIDPVTHRRRTDLEFLAGLNLGNLTSISPNLENALRVLQADQLAKLQVIQNFVQVMASNPPTTNMQDHMMMNLLGTAASLGLMSTSNPPIPSSFTNPAGLVVQDLQPELGIVNGDGRHILINSFGIPTANSTVPSLVSTASPEITMNGDQVVQEPISSSINDVSANSSASTPFESWDNGLNVNDLDADFSWKDVLECLGTDEL
ncbi:hypothetical protein J5N97_018800 [Dioscorea zingiberensis]|uniref:Uncharacterized protein n=1 Tax=Dioscorea zingiberensis TaxID=325984 RepID=A0A9D5CCZ0_9LILI|nr:hypothetical protein J5N97_018800 [Dioscorea zingiberensis]